MKKDKIIYLSTTGVISAVMVFSIISFTFYDHAIYPDGAFQHLGLPPYFKMEITIAKALGLLALWLPGIPFKVREFAYFGFGITLVSAGIAHASIGDPLYNVVDPLVFLVILAISYRYFIKLQAHQAK